LNSLGQRPGENKLNRPGVMFLFYVACFIAMAVSTAFGVFLVCASKAKLRKSLARFPSWMVGVVEPGSKKERLVFGFWRFCGCVALLFAAFMICLVLFTFGLPTVH
jgi:hypothetical protein